VSIRPCVVQPLEVGLSDGCVAGFAFVVLVVGLSCRRRGYSIIVGCVVVAAPYSRCPIVVGCILVVAGWNCHCGRIVIG